MAETTFRGLTLLEVNQAGQITLVNAALENLSRGVSGYLSKSVAGSSDVTLTDADENDEAKNAIIKLTGTLTGNINVIVPTKARVYLLTNATTGAFTITVKTSGGSGVVIAQAMSYFLYCDGTDVVNAISSAAMAASETVAGIVELATSAEINTGTDATRAISPDRLAGSNFGTFVVTIVASDPNGAALATGDGKAYWRVPSVCNGMDLVAAAAHVTTVSTSGLPTVQIRNVTDSVDMLSTKITIDANEKDSSTAATAAVIDTAHDDVATGDELAIDVDGAGTGAKGLMVELQFRLP